MQSDQELIKNASEPTVGFATTPIQVRSSSAPRASGLYRRRRGTKRALSELHTFEESTPTGPKPPTPFPGQSQVDQHQYLYKRLFGRTRPSFERSTSDTSSRMNEQTASPASWRDTLSFEVVKDQAASLVEDVESLRQSVDLLVTAVSSLQDRYEAPPTLETVCETEEGS